MPWIWQSYLRTALVPLLLIELALVAAYLLTNDAIREKNATALRAMAEERLLSSADLRAEIIGRQLEGIVRSTDFYRWLVGRALLDGDPEVDPEAPDPLANPLSVTGRRVSHPSRRWPFCRLLQRGDRCGPGGVGQAAPFVRR